MVKTLAVVKVDTLVDQLLLKDRDMAHKEVM